MNRPRILILENSIDVTGSLTSALRSALALNAHYDFVFVLPKASRAIPLINARKFQIFELPIVELSRRWISILIYFPNLIYCVYKIKKIVSRERISIIHVNDFYNMIMPLWRILGGKTKYLCYVNFIPDRFPAPLRKIWIKSHFMFSDKIVAVSNCVLKQLPINEKIIHIPNALPPEDLDSSLKNIARRKIFLFVGNFIEGKGQDMAIRAFAELATKYPEWKLRLVGGDMGLKKNQRYKHSLKNLATALHVEEKIEWQDFSKNIKEEYKSASIVLNFSGSESFSLTVQEAMFYGCTVIATDSGGPSELIDDGYSGSLVPVNNVLSMILAMKNLLNDERACKEMAINASTRIREKFSKAKTIDLLHNLYKYLININLNLH